MPVITKEIELPVARQLQMPAGLPKFSGRPLLSDVTSFDRYAGDWSRSALIGAGVLLGLGIAYAIFANAQQSPNKGASAVMQTERPQWDERDEAPLSLPEPKPVEKIEKTEKVEKVEVPPPEPKRGTLEITTEPRVAVYEGDRRLGRTPLEVKLEAGMHKLRFVSRKRHLKIERRYRVRANKTRKLDVHFGMSKLIVTAPKGTKVYINKRFVGRAPLKPISIVEGRHQLKLVKDGMKMSERLRVPPSRTVRYQARF